MTKNISTNINMNADQINLLGKIWYIHPIYDDYGADKTGQIINIQTKKVLKSKTNA